MQEKKHLEAIDILRRLRTLHPDERVLETQIRRVRWLRAGHLARDGRIDEAVAICTQLSAESPDLPDYRLWIPQTLFAAERQETAIEMLKAFAAEFPNRPEYQDELAFLYEARATQLCQSGEFEKATPILLKLAEDFRDRLDFRAELAFHAAMADHLEGAMATLQSVADAFKQWPDYRPKLARRLAGIGAHDQAGKIYEALSSEFPEVSEYKAGTARSLSAARRYDEAIVVLAELAQKHPDEPAWTVQLAKNYRDRASQHLQQGEFPEAVHNLSLAIELGRDDVSLWYFRALAQLGSGDVDGYRGSCREMVHHFAKLDHPKNAFWVAWTCVLAAGSVEDFSPVVALRAEQGGRE